MSSNYSTNLALELPGTGEQAGNWGATNNLNIGTLLEQAISGIVTQTITDGADTVITIPNGAYGVARNMAIECTGALTGARNLIVPANKKLYFIYNNTTGGYAVTVKVSGQTGVSVPMGAKTILMINSAGTDIVAAENYLASLTVGGNETVGGSLTVTGAISSSSTVTGTSFTGAGTGLTGTATSLSIGGSAASVNGTVGVANGGTGATSLTANNVILGNGTGAVQAVAPGSSGNVLTSNGTTWTSASALSGVYGQAFTSNGTFTIPAGVTALKVTVLGGGAGGGSNNGYGGGAGGAAIKYLTSLTPGNTLAVTVGTGGSIASSGNSSSVASGTESISTITGNGGTSGASGGAGGTATGGTINITGGNGGTPYNSGGVGGSSIFGGGGGGQDGLGLGYAATAGNTGGGGGGGSSGGGSGAAGGTGVVIFEW